MANIIYKVYSKFKSSNTKPVNFYEKEKALLHKIEMKNLGFSKIYIKKRNLQKRKKIKLILKENETSVLFLDDVNGYYFSNPKAFLVAVSNFNPFRVRKAEKTQLGVGRMRGKWEKALEDCNMKYRTLLEGNKSDFADEKFKKFIQYEYEVIRGNY